MTSLTSLSASFPFPLSPEIAANIRAALAEDIGQGDLTASLIPEGQSAHATVVTRMPGILCGTDWFNECFRQINASIRITWHTVEGDPVAPGQVLCELEGDARAILTGERTALNFLQLLSGVATRTRHCVQCVAGTKAQIVDTRKTIPGLRLAQKYAVFAGGGQNHRMALWDGILIKENHILAAGGINAALSTAATLAGELGERCRFVQVEVENLMELLEALESKASMILLDNFNLETLREAVKLNEGQAVLEASGGVTMENLRAIAETGVDRISVGALTKDVFALDLSMRFSVEGLEL